MRSNSATGLATMAIAIHKVFVYHTLPPLGRACARVVFVTARSYDRQRGINLEPSHDDRDITTPPVAAIEDKTTDGQRHNKRNGANNNNDTISRGVDTVAVAQSGKGKGDVAVAPCCDGGVLDAGSVGRILAQSLGNAVSVVRRNRVGGVEVGGGRWTTNENGGETGGVQYGSGSRNNGSYQDHNDSTGRSPWRSWNEPPPPALLTAQEIRNISAGKKEDDRRRQPPPSEVVAEVMPPPFHTRRRFNSISGDSTVSDGNNGPAARAASILSPAAGQAVSPGNEARTRGSNGEEPPSTTSSTALRRNTVGGGAPLVPRVAMLAVASSSTTDNNTEAAKKGKYFDPDQLECVRRHEVSVAERERRVRSLRTEAEKKSLFRARPLPAFLGGNSGGDSAGKGDRCQRGSGVGGGGAPGTRPELMAALDQVCDV